MSDKLLLWVIIVLSVITISEKVNAGPSLIISEVFYDTPGKDSDEEWIEIFNPTLGDIDISGYTIKDNKGTYTIALGTVVNSGQTMIFARDLIGFQSLYPGLTPDFDDLNLSLANDGGDVLRLRDAGGTLLDEVAWEGFITGWNIEADKGESLKRVSLGSGASAWLSKQTPNPGDPNGLSVVPEPASILLLASGLITMGVLRRKWKKKGV